MTIEESVRTVDWVRLLSPIEQATIVALMAGGRGWDEVGAAWEEAVAAASVAPYGGEGDRRRYYKKIRAELRKLLCGHEDYNNLRQELEKDVSLAGQGVLYLITATLSVQVGIAEALATPLVAIGLRSAAAIGLRAWCAQDDDTVSS